MFWELAGDKTGSDSLVRITAQNMGTLDNTPNHIYYPYSQFDNIKNNLGQGGASASPTVVVPTSTRTSTPTNTRTGTQTSTRATASTGASSGPNPTIITSNPITAPAPSTPISSDLPSSSYSATVPTTSPVWTPTPQPGDLCAALRIWDAAKAYTRGDVVRYLGESSGFVAPIYPVR
jgi:hypothetical protein